MLFGVCRVVSWFSFSLSNHTMYVYCFENMEMFLGYLVLGFYLFSRVFWCEDKLPLLVKILSFKVVMFRLKFFTFLFFFCWVERGGLFFDFK